MSSITGGYIQLYMYSHSIGYCITDDLLVLYLYCTVLCAMCILLVLYCIVYY